MSTKPLNHAQTIARYTELMRLINAGAYDERDENGEYGADGIEQGVADLDFMAAKQGLEFCYHQVSKTYSLESMPDEDKAAFKASQAAESEEIAYQEEYENRQASIPPNHFDTVEDFEEWEKNNQ
jgi:hypothetical protein